MGEDKKPKIHIDQSWKARVEAEREALKSAEEAAQGEQAARQHPPLPPASLATLVTQFATQALAALGKLPAPAGDAPAVDLEFARYAIDMIEVIQQKTTGNIEENEAQMISVTLHDLRMTFLDVQAASPAGGVAPAAGPQPEGTGRIITP